MHAKVTSFVFTLIILATVASQTVNAQYTADGRGFPLVSPINVVSPANITYSSGKLELVVNFLFLLNSDYANLTYSIDGQNNETIPLTGTQTPREVTRTYENGTTVLVNSTLMVPFEIDGVVSLPELEEGSHNITVYGKYVANNDVGLDQKTVYFTINNSNTSLNQNVEQIADFPEWMPLLLVVFIVIVLIIIYRYILNKLD
ncbi:MAG: hypothetical protein ACOWW1_10580 [archaeon]|nr:hypothetical protein [Candidatus Bathyarchaeum sp.]